MRKFNHSHADHHRHDHQPKWKRLTRRQKNFFHWTIIMIVFALLLHEGAQMADWAFLALAVIVEAS